MASGESMVRVLAVSDIHGSQSGFLAIREFIEDNEPDIIIIAGDITHFGPAEWARKLLNSIRIPAIAVNGNCDTGDVIQLLMEHPSGLLNRSRMFKGLDIMGMAYPFPKGLEPEFPPDIVVAHVPPRGCNDYVPGPGNIGDDDLKDFVLRHRPKLVLSGHVHESPGIVDLEGIICINPGPAKDGCGAVIDIADGVMESRLVQAS